MLNSILIQLFSR